ncbi:MAG: PmoA family protein [Bryobacteraceae bacterium]
MKNLTLLLLIFVAATAQVRFKDTPGKMEITVDGKPFSNLYYGPEHNNPLLHPLRSVSGTVVTRGYPIDTVAGEHTDHIWHHGLWYAHGDVNGTDFWRDLGPEKTGRMIVTGKPRTGKDWITVETEMVTVTKQVIGVTTETFHFARAGNLNIVDATITIRANRGQALKMGDTEEGSFGVRLAEEFRAEHGVAMTNSGGVTGKEIWGKRAKWVDYSTQIQSEKLGVLLLDHPSNPKHPTYWHARPYSLCSANPFGEHDFEKDKTRDGSVTIPAGDKLTFRYRVIIHPGDLKTLDPEKLFRDFAAAR